MWSLAVTAPCREIHASESLTRFAFDHYLFKIRKRVVRHGHVESVVVPAFPSYIFVAARSCWDFIREVTDVVGFVKFGSVVADVPEADVQALADKADEDWILPLEDPAPLFQRGQRVYVSNGVIQAVGIYDRPTSPGRAVVLVDILGRLAPVTVRESDLSPLVRQRSRPPKHLRDRAA
jgi:transcription antitermination factor NusG